MSASQILIVEDEAPVRRLLRRCLEADGHTVHEADSAEAMLRALRQRTFDLVTLDIGLGETSGLDLIKSVRGVRQVPIVMVTGKADVIDKVVGLELGADDYIAKPFHIREVQARIRAVLRRSGAAPQVAGQNPVGKLTFDGWVLDTANFDLTDPEGQSVRLTTSEFRLLMAFLTSNRRVLSRERLMDLTNGQEWNPLDRTIDNQVARLRKKIEADPANPALIKTVRGMGYIFGADVKPV